VLIILVVPISKNHMQQARPESRGKGCIQAACRPSSLAWHAHGIACDERRHVTLHALWQQVATERHQKKINQAFVWCLSRTGSYPEFEQCSKLLFLASARHDRLGRTELIAAVFGMTGA
jgi:hypothetical protein